MGKSDCTACLIDGLQFQHTRRMIRWSLEIVRRRRKSELSAIELPWNRCSLRLGTERTTLDHVMALAPLQTRLVQLLYRIPRILPPRIAYPAFPPQVPLFSHLPCYRRYVDCPPLPADAISARPSIHVSPCHARHTAPCKSRRCSGPCIARVACYYFKLFRTPFVCSFILPLS